MTRYLLDTNIIRFYAEKVPEVERFIDQSLAKGVTFFINETVQYEIESQFVEMNKSEKKAAKLLIKNLLPIEVETRDFRRAHLYRRQGRKIKQYHKKWNKPQTLTLPGLADSFIAVAAINEQIGIVTNNLKDFHLARYFGITLYEPLSNAIYRPINFRDPESIPNEYPKR
jgi:predicted nucleic acid-binding protein